MNPDRRGSSEERPCCALVLRSATTALVQNAEQAGLAEAKPAWFLHFSCGP